MPQMPTVQRAAVRAQSGRRAGYRTLGELRGCEGGLRSAIFLEARARAAASAHRRIGFSGFLHAFIVPYGARAAAAGRSDAAARPNEIHIVRRLRQVGAAACIAFVVPGGTALPIHAAQLADGAATSPAPSPTRSPAVAPAGSQAPANPTVTASPAMSRRLGLHATADASLTFVGQNTAGPGLVGPEANGFIAGSPLAPNTPYDLFSSAPQVSGNSGIGELLSTVQYGTKAFDIGLGAGLASVHGSVTNAAYWAESLLPTLNPHLGSRALPYAVAFPTHAGEDDGTATRLSILSGSVATADGALRLRAGWFDLAQTDRFVFAQPALTNINPAIAYAPAETLSSATPGLDVWQPLAAFLPLQGIDLVAKRDTATLELTNADLPSLGGDSARLSLGSLVLDRGEGTTFSAQVLHATTAGAPFATTVPFGGDPTFTLYPQGVLPTSMLSGQRQTIAGARSTFHAVPALGLDGIVEVGRAWYESSLAARPGTAAPGGYYHAGVTKARGRVTASLDFYRMEPRYATMILPYGVSENQWSVAFAWPGQWLKSNYQLIDNSVLGVNRQGYRLRYYVDKGPFELHLEYTDLRQIEAETLESAQQTGFIDGYYLPQHGDATTFGRQKRSALWAAWHPSFGDVTLDVVDDTLYRPFVAAHPEDAVSYEVPQAVLTYARHLSPNVVVAAGVGRYALKGMFGEPLDFAQRLFFVGTEVRQSARSSLLVSFRRSTAGGISTYPQVPNSPDFTGSTLIVEQRLHL